MLFVLPKRLFSVWISLNFCSDIFCHVGKQLDMKKKVNLKIYNITVWETNNYNIHIAQYLKKYNQPDDEIWSVSRMQLFKGEWPSSLRCYIQNREDSDLNPTRCSPGPWESTSFPGSRWTSCRISIRRSY